MSYFLLQIILAARNSDSEDTGWMRTLFFIILAIFYIAGSILKARANKKFEKKEVDQKRPGHEPSKPMPEVPKFLLKLLYPQEQPPQKQPRPEVRPPRRKVTRPQPVGQKAYPKAEKPFGLPTLELLEVSKSSQPTPQLQPQVGELPELTAETVMKLEEKPTGITTETPRPKHLAEPLLDYEDPEKLRRAILHYEILGKPLSLRDPSEHIIGL
jgi:hypothetical protein